MGRRDTQGIYLQVNYLLIVILMQSWSEGTLIVYGGGTEEDVELELILAPLAYARIAPITTDLQSCCSKQTAREAFINIHTCTSCDVGRRSGKSTTP